MTHARGPLLAAAIGVTAVLLSSCASETAGTAAPSDSTPPVTAATSAVSPTTASSAASLPKAPAGDVTKPGSTLKVGDRAVVPFKYGTDKNGTIALTVTAIEKGDNADLAKFGDKAKGLLPYFIRVSVENVDGSDLAYSSVSLRALGADGKSTGVIISGEVDKCQSETAKKDFTTAGAKYDTCVLQATREGSEITAATFDKGDDYIKSPITWKS